MSVAVVVYSETGTTLSVARRIMGALEAAGVLSELIRVGPDSPSVDLAGYQAVVLGAPVRGFDLAPPMAAFIARCGGLSGLKAYCYVTQAFPFKAWGSSQALARMAELCRAKGAEPCLLDVVSRSRGRERATLRIATGIVNAFAQP